MKNIKNKIKLIILTLSLTTFPQIVGATKYISCGEDTKIPYAIADIFSKLIIIVRIIIPILMVITGMISFLKVVSSSNADDDIKKAQKKLINSIIAAVIIFFIVSIINFAVSLAAGSNNSAMNCVKCFINPDNCETVESEETIKPGFISQPEDNDNSAEETDES